MRSVLLKILIAVLVIFVLIQFFRPAKNSGIEIPGQQITAKFEVPADVQHTFSVACNDCHSNTTRYPWYWHIQPAAWLLSNHFVDGKRHLNLSEFATYPAYRQYDKLKDIVREVKGGDMPLGSYTIIHRDAVLTDSQKVQIENWASICMKQMEQRYPADSLQKPK